MNGMSGRRIVQRWWVVTVAGRRVAGPFTSRHRAELELRLHPGGVVVDVTDEMPQ